jgi:phosphoglycolate phosphatase
MTILRFMSKGLIILDFDGTICDTRETIVRTYQMTMNHMGLPVADEATCAATIGLPLAQGFHAIYPDMGEEEFNRCALEYRRLFEENRKALMPKVFPGVTETLHSLHDQGFMLSVASSRSNRSLVSFLQDFGFDGLMSLIVGANNVTKHKPDPEPVLYTLKKLAVRPEDALVVGDMPFDILMGARAGASTCAVTYGNSTEAELREAGADEVISRFADLMDIAWVRDRA